ncbi:terpenoid synthase [Trichodelitschia bisporula]|uniref:Terpenoid synthase n=1 Tax=Trichodelitschia bisporula TaxID=703511 RepID=A0A6G1HLD2_9PEZI|nr:terpenoid synthase [Trichodelitschia bisporula]
MATTAEASTPPPITQLPLKTIPPRSSSHRLTLSGSGAAPFAIPSSAATDHTVPSRMSSKRSGYPDSTAPESSHHDPAPAASRSRRNTRSRHDMNEHASSSAGKGKARESEALPASAPPFRGPTTPPPTIGDDIIEQYSPSWTPENETILLAPFHYLYGHPGKDVRAQLIAAFNEWLQVPAAELATITRVVGMLHTASLLVDDVEDSSHLRRGVPVAHNIFGTAQTINSANYVYFLALADLTALGTPEAIPIFIEELLNLHRGQGMDVFWRDTLTCPTEEAYLQMVANKTGGLFRLAVRLMQACSPVAARLAEQGAKLDCVPLVSAIGLYFQILDDLLNLSSKTYTARKGLAEDLTEGKFSFPILHAIRADASDLTLLNILRQRTMDEDVKRYAIAFMERMGSFEYTRRVLEVLETKAFARIGEVEGAVGGEKGRAGAEGVRAIFRGLKKL